MLFCGQPIAAVLASDPHIAEQALALIDVDYEVLVPVIDPLEAMKDDESYFRLNNRMLRNPSIVNLFDGCALSIPCHEPGSAPVGLTIAGTQNTDRAILTIGDAVEKVIRVSRQ